MKKGLPLPIALPNPEIFTADWLYAAPIDRLAWKHSRQKTGRPCVGLKGTVVSLPHCEQVVFVSERTCPPPPPPPPPLPVSARLALQALQRFGSFLNPLSAKNICSPAVKTNSALHSEHFSTLSWNSMAASPLDPLQGSGDGLVFHHGPGIKTGIMLGGQPGKILGPAGEEPERTPNNAA
jgi:hypothetical protein